MLIFTLYTYIYSIHYGTWESAVYGLAFASDMSGLRKKLFKERLPFAEPRLQPRPLIHKSEQVNSWCLPFPGSDRSVILRSQRYRYENEKKKPIQIQTYVTFKYVSKAYFASLSIPITNYVFLFSL